MDLNGVRVWLAPGSKWRRDIVPKPRESNVACGRGRFDENAMRFFHFFLNCPNRLQKMEPETMRVEPTR